MVEVLRLGHRVSRDRRITTHVFLAARALGATKGHLSGEKDDSVLSSVRDVVRRWGGDFEVGYVKDWRKFIECSGSKVVHLTMYGMPIHDEIQEIRGGDVLVVVGGEKVPPEVYEVADFNVSVTSQPHSEVAALAIFLDNYFEGSELDKDFPGPEQRIKPSKDGKSFV